MTQSITRHGGEQGRDAEQEIERQPPGERQPIEDRGAGRRGGKHREQQVERLDGFPEHPDPHRGIDFAEFYGSDSVNCNSSVRWISEKLSSEISVSTRLPSAARCTDRPSMLSI